MDKPKTKRLVIDLPLFFQILLTLFSVYLLFDAERTFDGVVALVLINSAASLLLIAVRQKRIFTLYFCFMLFLVLFHFGQLILYVFGAQVDTSIAYDLLDLYSRYDLQQTLMFCLIAFNVMNTCGMLLVPRRRRERQPEKTPSLGQNEERGRRVYQFGLVLFCVLLIPVLIYDVQMITSASQVGYLAKYTTDTGIFGDLEAYLPAAVLCILVTAKGQNRPWKAVYYYALIRALALMLLVGNRGNMLITAIIYILAKHWFIKPYTRKNWISVAAICVGIVVLMPFIAFIRGKTTDMGFFEYLANNNPFTQFLSEFGSTLITPVLSFQYVDSFGFLDGKSFLGALVVLFPFSNALFGGIKQYKSVIVLLNPYAPAVGTLGGSLFAEFYINFGWYSLILAALFGIGVAKISQLLERGTEEGHPLRSSMLLYVSYGILLYVRADFLDVVFAGKRVLYLCILYYLFQNLVRRRDLRAFSQEEQKRTTAYVSEDASGALPNETDLTAPGITLDKERDMHDE